MKTRHKVLLSAVLGAFAVASAFAFTACDEDHVHNYGSWVVTAPTQTGGGLPLKLARIATNP